MFSSFWIPADSDPFIGIPGCYHDLRRGRVGNHRKGEGGYDDVMVGGDKRILLATDNLNKGLREASEKKNVQLAVRVATACGVVVGGMV